MLTTRQFSVAALVLFTSALLTGCGGGGGGGGVAAPVGPVASTLSFPLQTAYQTLVANGGTKTFVVSGSCTGTASKTSAAAITPAVFEANPAALSAATTFTATLTNSPGVVGCPPALAQTSTSYYDISYVPLGFNSVGVNYGVFLVPPTIPATVLVGGTGVVGTETLYTDITKVTGNGRVDLSYVVTADTATTAIVNLISKIYNAAGILTATEQDLYRISATGALVPVSADILYSTGIHLILN